LAYTLRYLGIIIGIIVAVFLAFLISFAVLRISPVVSCSGRVIETDYSVNKAIAIAYRIWMGALCTIVGAGFVVYSIIVLQAIGRTSNPNMAKKRASSRRNMTLMAFACSFSLLVEAVFMLTLAFLPDFKLNYVSLIIMLITEILPGVGILIVLDLSQLAKAAELTRASMNSTSAKGSSLAAASRTTGSTRSLAQDASDTADDGGSARGTTTTPSDNTSQALEASEKVGKDEPAGGAQPESDQPLTPLNASTARPMDSQTQLSQGPQGVTVLQTPSVPNMPPAPSEPASRLEESKSGKGSHSGSGSASASASSQKSLLDSSS